MLDLPLEDDFLDTLFCRDTEDSLDFAISISPF